MGEYKTPENMNEEKWTIFVDRKICSNTSETSLEAGNDFFP